MDRVTIEVEGDTLRIFQRAALDEGKTVEDLLHEAVEGWAEAALKSWSATPAWYPTPEQVAAGADEYDAPCSCGEPMIRGNGTPEVCWNCLCTFVVEETARRACRLDVEPDEEVQWSCPTHLDEAAEKVYAMERDAVFALWETYMEDR